MQVSPNFEPSWGSLPANKHIVESHSDKLNSLQAKIAGMKSKIDTLNDRNKPLKRSSSVDPAWGKPASPIVRRSYTPDMIVSGEEEYKYNSSLTSTSSESASTPLHSPDLDVQSSSVHLLPFTNVSSSKASHIELNGLTAEARAALTSVEEAVDELNMSDNQGEVETLGKQVEEAMDEHSESRSNGSNSRWNEGKTIREGHDSVSEYLDAKDEKGDRNCVQGNRNSVHVDRNSIHEKRYSVNDGGRKRAKGRGDTKAIADMHKLLEIPATWPDVEVSSDSEHETMHENAADKATHLTQVIKEGREKECFTVGMSHLTENGAGRTEHAPVMELAEDNAAESINDPKYKVTKKGIDPAIAKQHEEGRFTIIQQMTVRRPKLQSWVPTESSVEKGEEGKSESERLYEMRKQVKQGQQPAPDNSTNISLEPSVDSALFREVDHQSIGDQNQMKQHWETVIASENESALFPRYFNSSETSKANNLAAIGQGSGIVESPSIIEELSATKRQWENAMESEQRHLPEVDRDAVSTVQRLHPAYESRSEPNSQPHESIIQREIRLQHEREQEFFCQKSNSYSTSQPDSSSSSPTHTSPHIPIHTRFCTPTHTPTHTPTSTPTHTPTHTPAITPITSLTIASAAQYVPTNSEKILGKNSTPSHIQPSPHTHHQPAGSHAAQFLPFMRKASNTPSVSELTSSSSSTTSVSYEDAISTYLHPGETLIAKELREQREREQELLAHYTSMGICPPSAEVTDSRWSPQVSSTMPASLARGHAVAPLSNGNSVQSYEYRGSIGGETPIEKDMRIAYERERELRFEKGLPSERKHEEELSSPKGEVCLTGVPVKPLTDGNSTTVQQLAKLRLEQDMIKMRNLEDSMSNKGVIQAHDPTRISTVVNSATMTNGKRNRGTDNFAKTAVPKLVSTQNLYGGDKLNAKKLPSKAESKIEQELREMQEREAELRKTRSMLLGQSLKIDDSVSNNNSNNNCDNNDRNANGDIADEDNTEKEEKLLGKIGNLGKIALEWEQRIAGN